MARARAHVPADGSPPETPGLIQKVVLMSDDDWAYCCSQPEGGSPFVRRLVAERMADPDGPLTEGKPTLGMGRAVLMPLAYWTFCGSHKGGALPYIRRLILSHREANGGAEPDGG